MSRYTPRLNKSGIWQDPKWYSSNPFYVSGYGLPNCTCYAYGRFWEAAGSKPQAGFPLGDADSWFPAVAASGLYRTGRTAKLGAICCWTTAGSGHVAVVEQIKPNGNFIVSQSAYTRPLDPYPPDMANYWYLSECSGRTNEPVDHDRYKFQGFIYNPVDFDRPGRRWWYNDDRYLSQTEMEHNAGNVVDILREQGWTDQAIAGLLANMQVESTINPGINQRNGNGFGLVQWSPKEKYTDWAKQEFGADYIANSGDQQMQRIIREMRGEFGQYASTAQYPIGPVEFTRSTQDPGYLAKAFMINYEKPGDQTPANQERRAALGRAWYTWITGYTPEPGGGDLPIWLLIKITKRRRYQ